MRKVSMRSVGVAVLTLDAEIHLARCLRNVVTSEVVSRILVVDSSSGDNTIGVARDFGCDVLRIRRSDFNHGATRERARRELNTEIVTMMTQDAYPVDSSTLGKLVAPINEGIAVASYARQIPQDGAGLLEAFPRTFNYGAEPQLKGLKDVDRFGVYTFFCSNTCAAYLNEALDGIGGFKPTLTSEDYLAAFELLLRGHKVAYVPEAVVLHSHRYSLKQEFQRYFDTGYVRAGRSGIKDVAGPAERRGLQFFHALLRRLWNEKPLLIPYAIVQTAAKWLGYRVGFHALGFPTWIKKSLSAQKYYWSSPYYQA